MSYAIVELLTKYLNHLEFINLIAYQTQASRKSSGKHWLRVFVVCSISPMRFWNKVHAEMSRRLRLVLIPCMSHTSNGREVGMESSCLPP